MNNTFATGLLILASMACTIVGNLLLKTGVGEQGISTIWPFSLLNLKTFLGALVFCLAMVFYLMVLKTTALNLAQSIFSIQFVLVIVAANVILGEPISFYRWIGIAFVAIGLLLIAISPTGN